jgi:hypothetical protein
VKPKQVAGADPAAVDLRSRGRDEMNLAEFPITLLANRAPGGIKTLVFEDAQGRLTVTGSDAYGLPTAADADVLIGLIQITKLRNDFAGPTVHFTRYELLRLMGWANEGKNYRRIDESLSRWVGVSLHYDRCWWDNRSKRYGDAKMHILDGVVILDGTTRETAGGTQQVLPLSSFTWNKTFLESCQADNLKRLDLATYFALRSAISKRMYRFLDKRFYRRGLAVFDLREFAIERIGLSRNYVGNAGKIKEKLQPAIAELEAIGFLEPMSRQERYARDARGSWTIALVRAAAAAEPPAPDPGPPRDAPRVPSGLEADLIARGVTPATAAELVGSFPAEQVRARVEAFDWLTAKKDRRISTSPGGYLAASIRQGYAAPKGFESQADRAHRLAAEAEGRRQAEAAKRQAEAEQRAREQAERVRIDGYWDGLSPAARAALTADALARANSFVLGLYRKSRAGSPEAQRYLKIILDIHITGLLDGRAASADPASGGSEHG